MEKINWIQVAAGFLSGGAFGAILKQFFDSRRNRIQPVAYAVRIKSFYNSGDNKLINSEVILKGDESEYKFSRLYTGTIEMVNTGNADYAEFTFGITTSDKIKFIQVNPTTSDRHHIAEIKPRPSLDSQINNFDITLSPLNRRDKYTFDLLLTTSDKEISVSNIKLSSSKAVNLVNLASSSDSIIQLASQTFVEIIAGKLVQFFR